MWLLHTTSGALRRFDNPNDLPSYAILSHVWIPGAEQSFREIMRLSKWYGGLVDTGRLARVSSKIRHCCSYAAKAGFQWLWIDTCCIDKSSSAELSEAINSMFQWYQKANICYAYLHDVTRTNHWEEEMRRSVWFTRGWTLQELIAPSEVVFLSKDWVHIGNKQGLAQIIAEITGVDEAILLHKRSLSSVSVARRMYWASARETTRVEDQAYCLMGIFGVNLPTIYGEGRMAFIRLQEEILRRIPDPTIFLWGPLGQTMDCWPTDDDSANRFARYNQRVSSRQDIALLAPSPAAYMWSSGLDLMDSKEVEQRSPIDIATPSKYTVTARGIRMTLRMARLRCDAGSWRHTRIHLAVLSCKHLLYKSPVALILRPLQSGKQDPDTYVIGCYGADGQYMRTTLIHTVQFVSEDGDEPLYMHIDDARTVKVCVATEQLMSLPRTIQTFSYPCIVGIPWPKLEAARHAGWKVRAPECFRLSEGLLVSMQDFRNTVVQSVTFVRDYAEDPGQSETIHLHIWPCFFLHPSKSPGHRALCAMVTFDDPALNAEGKGVKENHPFTNMACNSTMCSKMHIRHWVLESKEFRHESTIVIVRFADVFQEHVPHSPIPKRETYRVEIWVFESPP